MGALIAVFVLFGSTIARQLMPGLSNMAKGSASAAKAAATAAKAQLGQLNVIGAMPEGYKKATKAMKKDGITKKGYNKEMRRLNQSNKMHRIHLCGGCHPGGQFPAFLP